MSPHIQHHPSIIRPHPTVMEALSLFSKWLVVGAQIDFPATTTRLAMFDWPYIRHFSRRSSHVCTYVDSSTHSDTHSALSSLIYEFAIDLNIYILPPLNNKDHSPISRAVLKPLSLSLRHRSVLAQSVVYHPFSALSHQRSSSMID